MDWRLLLSSLLANIVGIIVFSILFVYPTALVQNSVSSIAAVANVAILLFALFASSGFVLLLVGLLRRLPLSYDQTGVLAIGNFAVGIFSLIYWFISVVGYGADLATCGGFPPGYWTSGNATVNPCSILYSVHEDWISYIYGVILLTSVIAFWAAVVIRLRMAYREPEALESASEPVIA